jgi:hypothetical protein
MLTRIEYKENKHETSNFNVAFLYMEHLSLWGTTNVRFKLKLLAVDD